MAEHHVIVSEDQQFMLGTENGSKEIGAKVSAFTYSTDSVKKSHQWHLLAIDDDSNTDGRCFVVSVLGDSLVLDVEAACAEPGSRLIISEKTMPPEHNQLFIWDDGFLRSCLDPTMVVTMVEGSGQGHIAIYREAGLPGQHWKVI